MRPGCGWRRSRWIIFSRCSPGGFRAAASIPPSNYAPSKRAVALRRRGGEKPHYRLFVAFVARCVEMVAPFERDQLRFGDRARERFRAADYVVFGADHHQRGYANLAERRRIEADAAPAHTGGERQQV